VGALRAFIALGRRRVKKPALTSAPGNGSPSAATNPETKPKRARRRPPKQRAAAGGELEGPAE